MMKGLEIPFLILAILMGYLLGAILPGYFLPLWIKKMDIRKVGDGNPGVINVTRNAGFLPAFFTCIYDVGKGLLSIFIVLHLFRLPAAFAYLAGVSAVFGHKFPFYIGFKGGRGIAATVGMLLYILIKIILQDFTLPELLPFFIFILIYALLLLLASHGRGDLFTVSAFPFLGVYMLMHLSLSADLVFFLALVCVMAAEGGRNLARDKIRLFSDVAFSWRAVARLLALLIIPLGMAMSKPALLILIGCLLGSTFLFDLLRMIFPKVEDFSQREITSGFRLCKGEERGKLSGMTDFLLGVFLCFLLFDRNIAFAGLGFASLACVIAGLVEVNFGMHRIFSGSEKTLEGSLAFLSAAVTVAFLLWSGGLVQLRTALIGMLASVVVAIIPSRNADGLTIPLVSGVVMSLL